MVALSDHGALRTNERVGLPKRAIARNLALALERGRKPSSFSGSFRRYLDKLNWRDGVDSTTRILVYGGYIYVLGQGKVLITVLDIPPRYKKTATKKVDEVINNDE